MTNPCARLVSARSFQPKFLAAAKASADFAKAVLGTVANAEALTGPTVITVTTHIQPEFTMKKLLTLAAVLVLAACGEKKAEEMPAADSTATMAPAPAPMDSSAMPQDSMARDTTKPM